MNEPGLARALRASFLCVIALASAFPLPAQDEYVRREAEQAELFAKDKDSGDFVVAPIPILNPTLGAGLALGAAYLYQIDEESYPSVSGIGALYTDNKSKAIAVGQSANFHGNDWKIVGGLGAYDLNLEFYGVGSGAGNNDRFLPVNQKGWFAGVKALRRIKGDWYGGLSYAYVQVNSTFDLSGLLPGLPIELPSDVEFDSAIATLGLAGEYDSRDSQFSATRGALFKASFSTSNENIGSDFDFRTFRVAYNHYWSLKDTLVLAARGSGCAVPGDAPYYALCKFGVFPDLRGYVAGRYRDETMLAFQGEIRWHFSKKFSAIGFAGVGRVAESASDFNFENLLPSFGAGVRYLLSEKNGLNISIDYAYGKDSDAVYFFVGQAF
ncbi:MAG: hypothetical protein DRJ61_10030 [Acidobacteria bacterium]|nr:MAG: hypothetical protein DRJ61_10030 [Acidobacteriota bacterium]